MTRRVSAGAVLLVAVLAFSAAPAALATPGPSRAPEYWFDAWHIESLWHDGVRGQGVTIAEIDTGVNADLPELSGRILRGTDLGRDGDGRTDHEVAEFGHGTAMASIMVGRAGTLDITGMAPGAKILPIAVPLNGTVDAGLPDRLPDAIRYAADHGARVINMSVGGKRFAGTDRLPCPADEQQAVYYAMRKGAIVVASVGNTGPSRNTVEEPASCLGVLAVGAVDASGTVASFSSREPFVALTAPGVTIPSLGRIPGQAYSGNGTSQATALVSAAAALVWSRHPELAGRQVIARLLATLDARRSTPSPGYGYGILDAYHAVVDDVPNDAPNPIYDLARPFLSRDAALARPFGTRPAKAAKGVGGTGEFEIGDAPRITSQVKTGIGIAGAGLLLLVGLLVTAARRRRTRTLALAVPPSAVPVQLTGAFPADWRDIAHQSTQSAPVDEGEGQQLPPAAPTDRPSPRPGPAPPGSPR